MLAAPLCALCRRRPVEEVWRPFCSERCRLQDLACWLDGVYRVAVESAPADDPPADADPDQNVNDP